MNANIVIRNKSPGDTGSVTQTNSSQATAQAANDNAVNQSATQSQTLAGDGSSGGQSQSVSQSAPTTQNANATAISVAARPALNRKNFTPASRETKTSVKPMPIAR